MNPLISVIVPIYNAEKYLHRCLDSIVNQTYKNLQIILIDDGSEDESSKICDEYKEIDNRIIVIHKENSGVSDSRNIGLDKSEGEYIGFVDADDYIEPSMYEKLYKSIIQYNADICCCGYTQEFDKYFYEKNTERIVSYDSCADILDAYLRQDKYSGIGDGNWNKLFTRRIIENIRYSKYANGEDVLFQFNCFITCKKLVCIPDLLYHYVCNDESASNGKFTESKASILDVADTAIEVVKREHTEVIDQAYAFQLTWYISLLQKICDGKKNKNSIKCRKRIRNQLKKELGNYYRNIYSKRLDQYYLMSELIGVTGFAIIIRKIIRKIKPSTDKKDK